MACQQEASVGGSPEEVVRQYQAFLDNNDFDQAKKISTPAGREMLEGLAVFFGGASEDSTVVHTNFLSIDCKESGNTARCDCRLQDEFETYASVFQLRKINDRWLIEPNDEGVNIEQSESEEILEDPDSSTLKQAPY
ncbi:MAG: hypothetical protein DHS20C18_05220 [Saprospiraceae bacterium]|nr:MAG: hypothetical protein DHS20C18_05220 [Saprospiraceae bacterium]